MKKNAGIKSKKEAAQRLIDGEVFYWEGSYLSFREDDHDQPFRTTMISRQSDLDMNVSWGHFREWQIEIDWRENIGKGVWCWVWDDETDKFEALVKKYEEGNYYPYLINKCGMKHAEPMTEAEVMEYILK